MLCEGIKFFGSTSASAIERSLPLEGASYTSTEASFHRILLSDCCESLLSGMGINPEDSIRDVVAPGWKTIKVYRKSVINVAAFNLSAISKIRIKQSLRSSHTAVSSPQVSKSVGVVLDGSMGKKGISVLERRAAKFAAVLGILQLPWDVSLNRR